jgi:hypothetical protein
MRVVRSVGLSISHPAAPCPERVPMRAAFLWTIPPGRLEPRLGRPTRPQSPIAASSVRREKGGF